MNNNVTTYWQQSFPAATKPATKPATPNVSATPATVPVATSPPTKKTALSDGLRSISTTIGQFADGVESDSASIPAIMDEAKVIGEHYNNLIDTTSKATESHDASRLAATEAKKASNWISRNYPDVNGQTAVPVVNFCSPNRKFDSFIDLWERGQQ